MATRPKQEASIYRLFVTLADIEPPIWRRIEVPAGTTLDKLHSILQAAMGWQDYHLHMFEIEGHSYSVIDEDDPWMEEVKDERRVSLAEAAPRKGTQFLYTYDMGDGWEHLIEVEEVEAGQPTTRYPLCLEGARSCPPEDCGGPLGYEEFLEAIDDEDHPDHEDMLDWIGGAFDPEDFGVDFVNKLLRKVR